MNAIDPPVLLFAFANYYKKDEDYLPNLPEEARQITENLKPAEKAGLCQVVVLHYATLEDVINAFHEYNNRIILFHFAGHANAYSLILENPFREMDRLFMKGFAGFLATRNNLKVVFLNGCSTNSQSQMLIEQGISAVITTHKDISDEVARLFATSFYKAIGIGRNIEEAYKEAVAIIRSQENYQNTRGLYKQQTSFKNNNNPWNRQYHPQKEDIAFLNLPDIADQPLYTLPPLPERPFPKHPFPGIQPYTSNDRKVFWGRDYYIRQIYQIATADVAPRLLIIYGARGVGKTSFLQAGLSPYLELEHTVVLWKFTKNNSAPPIQELHNKKPIFLLIDDPPDEFSPMVIGQLSHILKINAQLRIIITLFTDKLCKWKFENYTVKTCYLPPLSLKQIQKVINGGYNHLLINFYNAKVEPELTEHLSYLLAKDDNSSVGALLQFCLQMLWKKAIKQNPEQPFLKWQLMQQLFNAGLWIEFMEQQLLKINNENKDAGLLLNLLAECLSGDNSSKIIKTKEVEDKYKLSTKPIDYQLQQLLDKRLLGSPASSSLAYEDHICLSHQLLEKPLLQLFHSSKLPGQEVRRTLQHHLNENSVLNETSLNLLKNHLHIIPELSGEANALRTKSELEIKRKKRKTRNTRILNFSIIFLVLTTGFLLDNPFLLLFLLLLITAHKGAETLNRK